MGVLSVWRLGLLAVVMAGTTGGYTWMMFRAGPSTRQNLALLTTVLIFATIAVFVHYRKRMTWSLATANLALGGVLNLLGAAVVVAVERLWTLGLVPALATNWHHFAIGVLGICSAFLTWTWARGKSDPPPSAVDFDGPVEPAPPVPSVTSEPDWEAVAMGLDGDPLRVRQLAVLRRLDGLLKDSTPEEARRAVHQEVRRLATEAGALSDPDDVLSVAASLLEWGAQKLPELAELDMSDLLMAKAIADIRSQRARVTQRFVDHRRLLAIHPIDRATANEKCDARAQQARDALGVLEANGMRLSEELVAAEPALDAFKSVTGFQVLRIDDERYVTFEGNGRREALRRAFPELGVLVEVREYVFEDPEVWNTMVRRVERVRRWKSVVD